MMEMYHKWIVVLAAQLCKFATIELYIYKGLILWYVIIWLFFFFFFFVVLGLNSGPTLGVIPLGFF
jgi:hypothetical protein